MNSGVTTHDIATTASVLCTAVGLAMRGSPCLGKELPWRICKLAAEMGCATDSMLADYRAVVCGWPDEHAGRR